MRNKPARIFLSIAVVNALFCCAGGPLARAAGEGEVASSTVGQAAADTPPAGASGPVMLLGVFAGEKADKSLRDAVIDRLTRLGEEVSLALDSVELIDCRQVACYAEISARLNAQRLLRVDVYESTPRRYYLEGVLFERQTGSTRSAKSSCEDCSSESLRAALGDMTARMVAGGEPVQRSRSGGNHDISPPSPPSPPRPSPVSPDRKPLPRQRWTPERITLVTLLSTLSAATLVGTILLPARAPATDSNFCSVDRMITSDDFRCFNVATWTIGGTVLTALSTTSLALTLRQFLHKETGAY